MSVLLFTAYTNISVPQHAQHLDGEDVWLWPQSGHLSAAADVLSAKKQASAMRTARTLQFASRLQGNDAVLVNNWSMLKLCCEDMLAVITDSQGVPTYGLISKQQAPCPQSYHMQPGRGVTSTLSFFQNHMATRGMQQK